ncbi:MAG TPA: hypothetical protein VGE40_13015 [Bacilli bacterium]
MKISMQNGLPVVEVPVSFQGQDVLIPNILLDSGCSVTIFDTDVVRPINLTVDPTQGRVRYMYGVGGRSEICYERLMDELSIFDRKVCSMTIQLGSTLMEYGYNGIIGVDFMQKLGMILDFSTMTIRFEERPLS